MDRDFYKTPSLLSIVMWFASLAVSAETKPDSLNVRVYNARNLQPVEFCNIIAKNVPTGALADEMGRASLRVGPRTLRDTLLVSSVGYEKLIVALTPDVAKGDTLRIYMNPKEYKLREVTVMPSKKTKTLKKGKRHGGGLTVTADKINRGDCFAWEAGRKNRRTWLTGIEMQSLQYPDSAAKSRTDSIASIKGKTAMHPLRHTRMRINVYDAENRSTKSSGIERWDYTNILNEAIIVDYSSETVSDGIFRHSFKEPVLLPEKALVEIEILDNIPENEMIFFKSNLFGKGVMSRNVNEKSWVKLPVATPFTLVFLEEKL